MESFILASSSPRRKEILESLGIQFSIFIPDIDEKPEPGLSPAVLTEKLAREKARKAKEAGGGCKDSWILGADTLIECRGKIIGKPSDREDARKILSLLAGRIHRVITGFALYSPDGTLRSASNTSLVVFSGIDDVEMEDYLSTGEWRGAAGAYKIQGYASRFITEIRGSFSSVMGLPIRDIYVMLREAGYAFGRIPGRRHPPDADHFPSQAARANAHTPNRDEI